MTLLDRYFIPKLLTITIFSVVLFTIAWLAPETLFKAIEGISNHTLTPQQGVAYLVYQIPIVWLYCIPISMLIGSVFFFRQMSLNTELVAIFASGISFRRVLVPVAFVGILMSGLFFVTQQWMVPWASRSLRILSEETHVNENTTAVQQITFMERTKQGVIDKFILISPKTKTNQGRFIFLLYQGTGDALRIGRIVTANQGRWLTPAGMWDLEDGIDYTLDEQGVYSHIQPFKNEQIKTTAIAQALLQFPSSNPAELDAQQLTRYVRLLRRGHQTEDARFYDVRLFQRYFFPFVPLMFALLGAGIGIERSRAKRNLGLTYAALLLLIYNVLVPTTTTLGSIGILPSPLAAILPLILGVALGYAIIEIRKSEG